MKIHNVNDRRSQQGWIGSWEAEPLNYDKLKPEDIGRSIIYRDFLHQQDANRGKAEVGVLVSWRNGVVFGRYSTGDTAASADPADLWFGIKSLDNPQY